MEPRLGTADLDRLWGREGRDKTVQRLLQINFLSCSVSACLDSFESLTVVVLDADQCKVEISRHLFGKADCFAAEGA